MAAIMKQLWLICCAFLGSTVLRVKSDSIDNTTDKENLDGDPFSLKTHELIVADYFQKREFWKTSNLGSIIFKNQVPTFKAEQTFLVYFHAVWNLIQRRHVYSFGSPGGLKHPLEGCDVQNCKFTGTEDALTYAHAVVVDLKMTEPPAAPMRVPEQRWVFMTDESPWNTLDVKRLPGLAGVFNWSMTYRTDSDVPIPYGRTVPLPAALTTETSATALAQFVPNWRGKRRDVLAAALMSNCGVARRMRILRELRQYVPLHVYGGCQHWHARGSKACRNKDCKELGNYLFYLAFENSECRQYISEKVFHNAFMHGAIPVILGANETDCTRLLPPGSFLHSARFSSAVALAEAMRRTADSHSRVLRYHAWRRHFAVVNEHGYAGTTPKALCRLCQALNYNSRDHKVYDEFDLRIFLDPNWNCQPR